MIILNLLILCYPLRRFQNNSWHIFENSVQQRNSFSERQVGDDLSIEKENIKCTKARNHCSRTRQTFHIHILAYTKINQKSVLTEEISHLFVWSSYSLCPMPSSPRQEWKRSRLDPRLSPVAESTSHPIGFDQKLYWSQSRFYVTHKNRDISHDK